MLNNLKRKEEVNFLDLNIKLIDGEFKTDLFVKATDTHRFFGSILCHFYHCKKPILYSPGLIGSVQIMRDLISVVAISKDS